MNGTGNYLSKPRRFAVDDPFRGDGEPRTIGGIDIRKERSKMGERKLIGGRPAAGAAIGDEVPA